MWILTWRDWSPSSGWKPVPAGRWPDSSRCGGRRPPPRPPALPPPTPRPPPVSGAGTAGSSAGPAWTTHRMFFSLFWFFKRLFSNALWAHSSTRPMGRDLRPNSWKYDFVEVSGHSLEILQTWGLYLRFWLSTKCYSWENLSFLHWLIIFLDFWNHQGGMVFLSGPLLSKSQAQENQRWCSARDWDGKDYLRIIPRVVW